MVRCGFCARGECKFGGCCARSLRIAATAKDLADSGYEPNTGANRAGGGSAPAGAGDSGKGDGWRTQGSSGSAPSAGDYWGGGDGWGDGGRFAALRVEGERHEEKIVRGAGLMHGTERG